MMRSTRGASSELATPFASVTSGKRCPALITGQRLPFKAGNRPEYRTSAADNECHSVLVKAGTAFRFHW